MRSLAAPFAALLLVAAAPAGPPPGSPTFDYASMNTKCLTARSGGHDDKTLDFNGPGEKHTSSVLVVPPGLPRTSPAVLWVHWLGEPATTNHTEFASDAQDLAKHGVVSLLVDMPWSQKNWFTGVRSTDTDYADTVAHVIALRRALDCLTQVAGVDKERIAFVGHDFGAMEGALLLAVDDRARYAVLMTPTLSFWEWYLLGKQPADPAAYVAQMSAFDLPGWLAKGKQKATLLQFGQNDEYVAQATGIALRNAVPDRDRTLKAYKLDHALDDPTARDDRRAWLIAHLGV
jgi:predicted esterase